MSEVEGTKRPRRTAKFVAGGLALVVVVSLLLGLGAELVLRATGKFRTWSELNGDPYVSPTDPAQFWLPWIGKDNHELIDVLIEHPEFTHDLRTNALGLREDELEIDRLPGTVRIVGLGDSFAMGYGVEIEDTYLQVMERMLGSLEPDTTWETINAGVAGHDPVFSEQLLRRRLLPFKPDIVLLLVNQSDVFDIVSRGGTDRFDENGAVRSIGGRPLEFAFEYSHLVRAAAMAAPSSGGTNWLHWEKLSAEDEAFAGRVILEVAHSLARLGEEQGFRFLLVAHPHRYQMFGWPRDPTFKYLGRPQIGGSIEFVDTVGAFREAVGWSEPWPGPPGTPPPEREESVLAPYFYPIDGHYPPRGHELLAEQVVSALQERGWVGDGNRSGPRLRP